MTQMVREYGYLLNNGGSKEELLSSQMGDRTPQTFGRALPQIPSKFLRHPRHFHPLGVPHQPLALVFSPSSGRLTSTRSSKCLTMERPQQDFRSRLTSWSGLRRWCLSCSPSWAAPQCQCHEWIGVQQSCTGRPDFFLRRSFGYPVSSASHAPPCWCCCTPREQVGKH